MAQGPSTWPVAAQPLPCRWYVGALTQFGQVDGLAGLGRPARWGSLGDMFGGFDRRFPAPPESYENYFKAYHMSRFGGRERKDVSYGGKGAFSSLTQ